MHITVVSMLYPPETGPARLMGQCVEQFLKQGHTVEVLTTFPSYPVGKVYPGYKKRLIQTERVSESLTIRRLWSFTSPKRESMKYRMIQFLTFATTAFVFAWFCRRPDFWYVPAYPYFQAISIGFVRWIRGGKLLLRVQDSWPEAPIALGYVRSKAFVRFLLWTERKAYRSADVISTLSPEMANHLIERGADPNKTVAIYNWVDHEKTVRVSNDELKNRLGLANRFVILYAGNIGEPQGLSVVLDAAELLEKRIENELKRRESSDENVEKTADESVDIDSAKIDREMRELIDEPKSDDKKDPIGVYEIRSDDEKRLEDFEGRAPFLSKQSKDLSKIIFVLIGNGGEKKKLEKEATRRNLKNILFLPPVSETEILDYFAMADALFIHLRTMTHRIGTVPSKTQVYMATGKPILVGAFGAVKRIFEESKAGVAFSSDSAEAMLEATIDLYHRTPEELRRMGESGQKFARDNFDMQTQCEKTLDLMKRYSVRKK